MIRNGNSCVTRLKHRIATESICPLVGTSQPCVLNPRLRRMNLPLLFLVSVGMLSLTFAAHAGGVVRAEIEPGVSAVFRGGRDLFLECRPPRGEASQTFFDKYLANPNEWRIYKDRIAVAIHFDRLRPEVRRRVLLTVFDRDYIDESGLRVGLEGQWVGERRHDPQNTQRVGGYPLVNLRAVYQPNLRQEYFVDVTNLTDRSYQTFAGFPQPGRSVFGGLRYRH